MKSLRILYHMGKADFLERTRRYSFLLAMALTLYLAYTVYRGQLTYKLEDYRGVYNSAWMGCEMALVITAFLTLIGFYVVKNTIQRDQETRVGQILAATPMSKPFYTFAKMISNFSVLATMVFVLVLAALAMQLLRAESRHVDLFALLSPIVAFSLPALALTAALAVLFETIPGLRGGVGNVVYFFVWISLLMLGTPVLSANRPLPTSAYFRDFNGIASITGQMQTIVRGIDPEYKGGSSLGSGPGAHATKTFLFTGLHWNQAMVLSRMMWLMIAGAIALLASLFFNRFDPARSWQLKIKKKPSVIQDAAIPASLPIAISSGQLTPLTKTGTGSHARFVQLVVSELRLMLKGQRWWWYMVAVGLFIACLASPLSASRGGVILAAWLWPILLWSQMGAREARYSTQSLLFSSDHALARQLPAAWTAGVLVAALTGGGLEIRLLLAGDSEGLAAWGTACLFIPTLALALGAWSGGRKAFEALYTVWWYIGPANHVPGADFIGTSANSALPGMYLLFTGVLLAAAYLGRRSKMAYA
ncbi:MAG TPA: hypothetical protein VH088_15075 [Terriglobales bacterium]|jgi:hypothetical protein|nr:hypothetical protein [Terriglobales bacterium]